MKFTRLGDCLTDYIKNTTSDKLTESLDPISLAKTFEECDILDCGNPLNLNEETDLDDYVVYDYNGYKIAGFDSEEEAVEFAIDNEDADTVTAPISGLEGKAEIIWDRMSYEDEEECELCGERFESSDLLNTDAGKICHYCFDGLRSHGEPVTVYHESISTTLDESGAANKYAQMKYDQAKEYHDLSNKKYKQSLLYNKEAERMPNRAADLYNKSDALLKQGAEEHNKAKDISNIAKQYTTGGKEKANTYYYDPTTGEKRDTADRFRDEVRQHKAKFLKDFGGPSKSGIKPHEKAGDFLSVAENLNTDSITEAYDFDYIEDAFDYFGQYIELGRDIVYYFVDDEESAEELYNNPEFDDLETLEDLALEGLINNALVAANGHEDATEWMDHIKWSLCHRMPDEAADKVEEVYNTLTTDADKLKALWKCINEMSLENMVTDSL